MLTPTRCAFAAVTALALSLPAPAADGPRAKINRAGKAATALAQGKSFGGQGSAFCIHSDGIFLTNEHVVGQEETITLFFRGAGKTVRALSAKVVRADKALDLALLRVEGEKDLPVLPLAPDNNLSETDEVIAFGFPFGRRLATDATETPAISVNVGKVTSLREKNGELHRIQLDAVLNPGNSGGPVLDKDGKVVGVVVSGVPGAGVNFAIPVSHVHRFLARPEIVFDPPALKVAGVHDTVAFQARAISFGAAAKPLELELVLKSPGAGAGRRFKMKLTEGTYRASAIPIPRSSGPVLFRLTAVYTRGAVRGEVEERTFKVGGESVALSEVRYLVGGARPRVRLRDGTILRGELTGLDAVPAQLGPASVKLDLARAGVVRVRPPAGLEALAALIVARRDGKEVGRLTRSLMVQGVTQPGDEEPILDIDVAPLEKDVVVRKLDAPIADVAVGGGGRYLILHLPRLRKLAVFDANKAKVVKLLPAPDADLKFTAGLDQLVVALPGSATLKRYNLKTLEEEWSAAYPAKMDILAMSMGSASHGPLLVFAKKQATFQPVNFQLSLDKLEVRDMIWVKAGMHMGPFQNLHLRSSADGKAMGFWSSGTIPSGVTWIRWATPAIARSVYSHTSSGHVIPGPGGKVLCTGLGMFTSIVNFPGKNTPYPGSDANGRYLPAHHGDYYLYLGAAPTFTNKNPPPEFAIYKMGLDKPILRPADVEVPQANEDRIKHDFTLDKRFHLIPEAKLLIVIPPGDDRLMLYRVDLDKALGKRPREKK